ncbi:MAG: sigma-70 family RNA polymerase sigma factor [Planctomycetota bacterium]
MRAVRTADPATMRDFDDSHSVNDSIGHLIEPAKLGDEDARGRLVQQLQSYYYLMADRHLDRKLRNKINPSDIVQESLAKAFDQLPTFRGTNENQLHAWVRTILMNEIQTVRRKFRQPKRNVELEEGLNKTSKAANLTEPPSDSLTPSSRAVAQEELSRLRSRLHQLPADYEQVIKLRSLQRLSFKETAEVMGRTVDSTTKLWYRAIVKLKDMLGDSDESE